MRILSLVPAWFLVGGLAVACGGSAFSSNPDSGGSSSGASAGTNHGGDGSGAGVSSAGASDAAGDGSGAGSSGGSVSGGGSGNVGGDVALGGSATTGGSVTSGGSTTGGSTTGGSMMGGSTSGGSTTTGGSGGGPAVDETCPSSLPAANGACNDGLLCSYGNDLRIACRSIAKCSGGQWAIEKHSCEQLRSCQNVVVGAACDQSEKPCALDGSIYCACTGCSGGLCSDQYKWSCAGSSGGSGCPKIPPNEGQSCSSSAQCSYGSCSTGNGVTASCDGTWAWMTPICPL